MPFVNAPFGVSSTSIATRFARSPSTWRPSTAISNGAREPEPSRKLRRPEGPYNGLARYQAPSWLKGHSGTWPRRGSVCPLPRTGDHHHVEQQERQEHEEGSQILHTSRL